MAIIKCPECGNDVSDKAPFCPHCGVEIVGKVDVDNLPTTSSENLQNTPPPQPKGKKPKKNYAIIAACFLFALIICVIGFLFYQNQLSDKEREAYEYAMASNDTVILRNYLDTYPDAEVAHRDNIKSRLEQAIKQEQAWTNSVVSNSIYQIKEYLRQYPNSTHQQEAEELIDSLDWVKAKHENTAEAYQNYINEHTEGAYYAQAEEAMKKRKGSEVRPEEKQMVRSIFRKFFQSINTRDEDGLIATCEDILTNFLGKPTATKSDVISFMRKIYKPDISNMNWFLGNDFEINKREIGDEEYEYQVTFSVRQEIDHTETPREAYNYRITANVSPDGKISEMNMTRIVEEEQ